VKNARHDEYNTGKFVYDVGYMSHARVVSVHHCSRNRQQQKDGKEDNRNNCPPVERFFGITPILYFIPAVYNY
jgi:hypothetical protein